MQEVRYLVTVESVEVGPLLPPQQVAGIIRTAILPTSEALSKLESEGEDPWGCRGRSQGSSVHTGRRVQ
jgi:hypothetical protein